MLNLCLSPQIHSPPLFCPRKLGFVDYLNGLAAIRLLVGFGREGALAGDWREEGDGGQGIYSCALGWRWPSTESHSSL